MPNPQKPTSALQETLQTYALALETPDFPSKLAEDALDKAIKAQPTDKKPPDPILEDLLCPPVFTSIMPYLRNNQRDDELTRSKDGIKKQFETKTKLSKEDAKAFINGLSEKHLGLFSLAASIPQSFDKAMQNVGYVSGTKAQEALVGDYKELIRLSVEVKERKCRKGMGEFQRKAW
jgi:hypothetical protein